jgi:hypothetical protein
MRSTLHNPRRARHRGGLWDLGDPGSIPFREFVLEWRLAGSAAKHVTWLLEPSAAVQSSSAATPVEIYQDSSGGENWASRNHVNRDGRVPLTFRGYRVQGGGETTTGVRAQPVVALQGDRGGITLAIAEFWQQFPKSIEVRDDAVRAGLFPPQYADLFELQGGEQKTHTSWLRFSRAGESTVAALDWVGQPIAARATPQWYADAGVVPHLTPAPDNRSDPFERLMHEAIDGDKSLVGRRELIDEYGWRNYGDMYADHEQAYYTGPPPLISHYNNQYDALQGTLLQYLRTGDQRWFGIGAPLARHVMDIDIYHTNEDRAAYNGGLFWHTDHYVDAATCTHRSFSRVNYPQEKSSYGGGPSVEHNYTTGLLHYYFLTGDPQARVAVIGLADWVMHRDDGHRTLLALVDAGPTGLASSTFEPSFHGPGRGCGNSINALLDAWRATNQRRYLDKAEELIRRSVHPADNVVERDLLNVEKRWSYTVFLSVLSRYLTLKQQAGELDFMYAYAQQSLVAYARWMLEHEVPYFDRAEALEYPTETWAAQELRKANVLRLAAAHVDEPLRARLFRRGTELADRAWRDLYRFESRHVTRAVAICMIEGPRDQYLRRFGVQPAPRAPASYRFGTPAAFVPQRQRVLSELKTVRGIIRCVVRILDVRRWWALVG